MIDIQGPTYQDIWLNGKVIKKGQRDCVTRYKAIKRFLTRYKRRFTILDIGACHGYFGIRIAQDFDAVVVMADVAGPFIPSLCVANGVNNTMFIGKYLNAELLQRLSESEHFDVVLALSVLHHMSDWKEAVPHLLNMADHIIIETPPPGDWAGPMNNTRALWDELQPYEPQTIGAASSHLVKVDRPLLLFSPGKHTISRQQLYPERRNSGDVGPIEIKSTFTRKTVNFVRKQQQRDWIAGINLWNFRLLNGIYPRMDVIAEKMSQVLDGVETRHGDIRPWNFVYDGDDVHLIDWGDNRNNDPDDKQSLAEAIGTFLVGQGQ